MNEIGTNNGKKNRPIDVLIPERGNKQHLIAHYQGIIALNGVGSTVAERQLEILRSSYHVAEE